jgi:hypothetical protein
MGKWFYEHHKVLWILTFLFYGIGFIICSGDYVTDSDSVWSEFEEVQIFHVEDYYGEKVFTYNGIYNASFLMSVVSILVGGLLFNWLYSIPSHIFNENKFVRTIIFGDAILGVLLIRLTTSETIIFTILFWLSLVCAFFADLFRIAKKYDDYRE